MKIRIIPGGSNCGQSRTPVPTDGDIEKSLLLGEKMARMRRMRGIYQFKIKANFSKKQSNLRLLQFEKSALIPPARVPLIVDNRIIS